MGHFQSAEVLRTDDFEMLVRKKDYLQATLERLMQTSSMHEIQFSDKRWKMRSELSAKNEPFTGDELANLEVGEESELSDPLWECAKKHKKCAISLDEYCRRRGI